MIDAPEWLKSALEKLDIKLHKAEPCPFCGHENLKIVLCDDDGVELSDWTIPDWFTELYDLEDLQNPKKEDYDKYMTEDLAEQIILASCWGSLACVCNGAMTGAIYEPSDINRIIDNWNKRGGLSS